MSSMAASGELNVLGALFDDIHVTSHDFTLRLVGAAIVERLQALQIDRRTPATVREAATQVANRVVHEHSTWQRDHPSVPERIRALEREATGIESALRSGWALALRAYGYAPPAERGETQEGKVFDRIEGRRLGDVPPPSVPAGATVQGLYWERGH
jgi:hypothetical protein